MPALLTSPPPPTRVGPRRPPTLRPPLDEFTADAASASMEAGRGPGDQGEADGDAHRSGAGVPPDGAGRAGSPVRIPTGGAPGGDADASGHDSAGRHDGTSSDGSTSRDHDATRDGGTGGDPTAIGAVPGGAPGVGKADGPPHEAAPPDAAPPDAAPPDAARLAVDARPSVEVWSTAHRFVDLCLEIFNGYRPVVHIRAVSTPASAPAILHEVASATRRVGRRRSSTDAPGGARPVPGRLPHRKVRRLRLRVSEPSAEVAEVVAVLADARGAWALAFRLEHRTGTWLCTALTALC